ncbi:MAG TPA: PBP1A family penicillin-binding protein [Longimicrobiales bacterium]|nr:PBP1A family penicillin-binding protein [Longimicrobiales bacterium]
MRRRLPPQASLLGIGLCLGLLPIWAWQNCGLTGCPDVEGLVSYQPGGATIVLDRAGTEIADLSPVRHEVVTLESLPEHVAEAFIAIEDQRFREHDGVDWRRVGGALLANVRAGGIAEGSSTITMQLSRNLFSDRLPATDRTLRRKLLEARVAKEIESEYSKDEILELYLNHIYFGGSAYGIEAGAQRYFGRSAERLTLAQAALLAALPKAPSHYDPFENPESARERRDLVLELMAEQGLVDADEAERAQGTSLGVRRGGPRRVAREAPAAGYFVDRVRRILENRLGDELYREPLVVHTTLDLGLQQRAERELQRQLRIIETGGAGRFSGSRYRLASTGDSLGTDYLQGAIVVMDAYEGDVLALVGGRDYRDSQFDRATRAQRQAGSTIKPFVFAAALEEGWLPTDTVNDEPLDLELDGRMWSPRNFDDTFLGPVSLREALVGSRNVPTVRLASDVGPHRVASLAQDAGIDEDFRSHPMIALGITPVSPLELTTAFTSLANGGERAEPRFVLRVETADGDVLWEPDADRERVMEAGVAYLITDMLRDAVDIGTARRVREVGYRGPAAGKTGTTSDAADAWYVGYTPQHVATVWIGFDQRRPIAARASGGRAAAPVWGRLMRGVTPDDDGPQTWERPDDVLERALDPETGRPIEPGCEPAGQPLQTELFLDGSGLDEVCPGGDDRNFLEKAWAWIRGLFRGREDEPRRREEERTRRAEPRRADAEPEEIPRPGPLGIEIDSLPPIRIEILDEEAPDPIVLPDTFIVVDLDPVIERLEDERERRGEEREREEERQGEERERDAEQRADEDDRDRRR